MTFEATKRTNHFSNRGLLRENLSTCKFCQGVARVHVCVCLAPEPCLAGMGDQAANH